MYVKRDKLTSGTVLQPGRTHCLSQIPRRKGIRVRPSVNRLQGPDTLPGNTPHTLKGLRLPLGSHSQHMQNNVFPSIGNTFLGHGSMEANPREPDKQFLPQSGVIILRKDCPSYLIWWKREHLQEKMDGRFILSPLIRLTLYYFPFIPVVGLIAGNIFV